MTLQQLLNEAGLSHAGFANLLTLRSYMTSKRQVTRWVGGQTPYPATRRAVREALAFEIRRPIGADDIDWGDGNSGAAAESPPGDH